MKTTTTKRLIATARKILPAGTPDAEVRALAARVAESLRARRARGLWR